MENSVNPVSTRPIFPGSSKVLVLGAVKNCESHLVSNVLGMTLALVGVTLSWHLVESNSIDSTISILKKLSKDHKNFSFISLPGDARSSRLASISRARSRLLDYAISRDGEFDFVMVVDLDQEYKWNSARFETTLNDFDAIFCHQRPYYDTFALVEPSSRSLRSKFGRPGDLRDRLLSRVWRFLFVTPKAQLKYGRVSEPLRVASAFGGLAVYKYKVFLAGRYDFPEESSGYFDSCEHISFHFELRKKYSNLFVDPAFHVEVTNEHTLVSDAYHQASLIFGAKGT